LFSSIIYQIIASVDEDHKIYFFNTHNKIMLPIASIPTTHEVTDICFNNVSRDLLAFADITGTVNICRIPDTITNTDISEDHSTYHNDTSGELPT
jgi:hypothetical protein